MHPSHSAFPPAHTRPSPPPTPPRQSPPACTPRSSSSPSLPLRSLHSQSTASALHSPPTPPPLPQPPPPQNAPLHRAPQSFLPHLPLLRVHRNPGTRSEIHTPQFISTQRFVAAKPIAVRLAFTANRIEATNVNVASLSLGVPSSSHAAVPSTDSTSPITTGVHGLAGSGSPSLPLRSLHSQSTASALHSPPTPPPLPQPPPPQNAPLPGTSIVPFPISPCFGLTVTPAPDPKSTLLSSYPASALLLPNA